MIEHDWNILYHNNAKINQYYKIVKTKENSSEGKFFLLFYTAHNYYGSLLHIIICI